MTQRSREPAHRVRSSGRQGLPSMTERQLAAYLAARDAVRRVQRTVGLIEEAVAAKRSVH